MMMYDIIIKAHIFGKANAERVRNMSSDVRQIDVGSSEVSYFVPATCIYMIAPWDFSVPGTPTRCWMKGYGGLKGHLSGRSYSSILWDLRTAGVRMVASQHTVPVAFAWDKIHKIIVPERGLITVHCGPFSYTMPADIVADISVDLVEHPAFS